MKREKQKPPAPDEWTAEQLLAAATSVSLRQLERWRKQDLVPRPRTIHLGQGPGTCSVYPPGTDEQLLAVYRLYAKKRNAHYVRWYLWMEGYPIPLPAIRKTLDALVLAPIRELQTASGQADGFDATEVVVQQALPSLERSRRGRALRKRLNYNEADVQSAMTLFFGLLFGAEDLSFHSDLLDEEVGELSPAQILIRTLGVERAQTDRIGDGEPWLQSDVAENFQDASEMGLFSLENLSLALERVGREELDQAREMSDLFLWGLQMVVPYLEAQFGPGAFGLAMVHEISFDDPAWRAFLLLGFLCWRNKGLSSGIDQVLAAFRTLRDASADNTQAGSGELRSNLSMIHEYTLSLMNHTGSPNFTYSLSACFCLPRSAREKQTHFLQSHSLDGDHPRFECAQHLWESCSFLMSLPIFLIHLFP